MGKEEIRISDPTSQAMEKDYDESDVEHVLRVRDWRSWDELISWLRAEGDDDNELTPGEVRHMVEDFQRLKERGVEFTTDPITVYNEAKS